MDKRNISDFVNYKYRPLSLRDVVIRLLTIVALSIVCCMLGTQKLSWGVGFTLSNLLLLALVVYIVHTGVHKKNSRFLWDGISYLYISVILCLTSYRILTWKAGGNITLLLSMVLFLIVSYLCSGLLVASNIRKGRYNEDGREQSKSVIPYMFAALGFLFAKGFLSRVDTQGGVLFVAMSLLFISVIVGLGWTSLIRLGLSHRVDHCE